MMFEERGKIFNSEEFGLPKIDFSRFKKVKFRYIVGGAIILWLLFGIFYQVNPDERGVVRRFGKFARETSPGLKLKLPYPFEVVEKPKVTEVKRVEIGFRTIDPGPPARYAAVPQEALMLTGDENIINCQVIIQYRINDAPKYLFNIRGQEETVRDVAEAAIRSTIGKHNIDDALTEKKFEVQEEIMILTQMILDIYDSGIQVVAAQLQDVHPPDEVSDAFRDVASAREDRERLTREAEGYRNDVIPKARGEAQKDIRESEAYMEERIKRSEGDAEKFLLVLNEYQKAKSVTEQRLYIETMEAILPEIKKFIIKSDSKSGFLNILPLGQEILK